MLTDIFITTKGRTNLLEKTLKSFEKNTNQDQYRLTIIIDGGYCEKSLDVIKKVEEETNHLHVDYKIISTDTRGLGPSINLALAHINAMNLYYSDEKVGDKTKVSQFICYCQDDLVYSLGWLEKLTQYFCMFENVKKLGFASGIECIEHQIREVIGTTNTGCKIITKDWIRAANMFSRYEYWMSMWPIPRFDPETRRIRANPHDGIGSGVDWHFCRNHDNSVCRTNKTCLVLPGLLQHIGFDSSTWLDRELPESEEDKKKISEHNILK